MTDKTVNLIEALSQAGQAKTSRSPLGIFLRWILASALSTGFMVIIFGVQVDLTKELQSPQFIREVILLVAIIITSGLSAAFLSYPDIMQKKWIIYLPIMPILGFAYTLYIALMNESPEVVQPGHGVECVLCITAFSLVSGVWMMAVLRKQAVTHYYLAGGISLIAASSIGALTFRICEPTDSVVHLVQWHYLPILGFGLIGLIFGRKLLRW